MKDDFNVSRVWYKMAYDEFVDKYQKKKGFFPRLTFSQSGLLLLLCFGFYLLLSNGYQLYIVMRGKANASGYKVHIPQKKAWVYAKHNQHLSLLLRILAHAGYTVITSQNQPKSWDVLWAHDFPFRKDKLNTLKNLQSHQKVNKLPGTSCITLKVELARTKLKWIPLAYSIPAEKPQFLAKASKEEKKLWVQKSNNHRGIQIVTSKDVDTNAKSTFVQEFVDNPLLIDKKKFDIGVYVVYTSVNPLQVYVYEDDMLVRFCTEDYYPLDPARRGKYVVGDDYISLHKMPSLKMRFTQGRMSFKNALFSYMREQGYNTDGMWKDIKNCITEVFKMKAKEMHNDFKGYHAKQNFFELVRVDFVIDKSGEVWLMEVNMSPNLSPDSHPFNKMMYMKVIKNTLSIAGVLSGVDDRFENDLKEISADDRDVILDDSVCMSMECLKSCDEKKCQVCNQCLTDEMKVYIKKAYREHHNKGPFQRILPVPMNHAKMELRNGAKEPFGELNELLSAWFHRKCSKDPYWCQ